MIWDAMALIMTSLLSTNSEMSLADLYGACDYLPTLVLKLIRVCKRGSSVNL